ncbi:MAG: FMN-binding protein [Pseudomonadales bacterium]|jgi:electron transport complex protein RnfG|nr:FMN-binding protein [Pseudomonadales bacterium]
MSSGAADVIATDRSTAPPWPAYRALVGLGLACALLIVGVFIATLAPIAENRAARLGAAVLEVLPGSATFRPIAFLDGSWQAAGERTADAWAAFDDAGAFVGVALTGAGMGYADTIEVLYGYAPERQRIVGMRVLQTRETPGLGDKIMTHPSFLASVSDLDVRLDADGSSLRHPIVAVKEGTRTEAWQIDGITGATISSVAVADLLQASAERHLPSLHAQRQRIASLEAPETPEGRESP